MPSPLSPNLDFVCCHPLCELVHGHYGLSAEELERLGTLIPPTEPPPTGGDDPPSAEGTLPCPKCAEADPPRDGTLLGIPKETTDQFGRVLAAPVGPLANLVGAVGRSLRVDRLLSFEPAKVGTEYAATEKVITGLVLHTQPFDGHVLAFGNQDAHVGARWEEATPTYGTANAPPGPSAPAKPTYIRELQKDLVLLGYLSRSRVPGKKMSGTFDVHTLGAVLGLKEDLVENYGITVTDKPVTVGAAEIKPESFSKPITYQERFLAPFRIVRAWEGVLTSKNRPGQKAAGIKNRVTAMAKPSKVNAQRLSKVESLSQALDAQLDALPHRFVLERPDKPYAPFAPKEPSVTIAALPALAAGLTPAHAKVDAMFEDARFSRDELNSRKRNRGHSKTLLKGALTAVRNLKKTADKILEALPKVSPPAEHKATWDALAPKLEASAAGASKVAALCEFSCSTSRPRSTPGSITSSPWASSTMRRPCTSRP